LQPALADFHQVIVRQSDQVKSLEQKVDRLQAQFDAVQQVQSQVCSLESSIGQMCTTMQQMREMMEDMKTEQLIEQKRAERERKFSQFNNRMPFRVRSRTRSTHSTGACSTSSSKSSVTYSALSSPKKIPFSDSPISRDAISLVSPISCGATPPSRVHHPGSAVLKENRVRMQSNPHDTILHSPVETVAGALDLEQAPLRLPEAFEPWDTKIILSCSESL
jgi:hypothetical protein